MEPSFFPKLRSGDVEAFVELLREKYETSVVPGSYFDMPQHFRIGIGGDPEMTREGFERLGLALDEYRGAERDRRVFQRSRIVCIMKELRIVVGRALATPRIQP